MAIESEDRADGEGSFASPGDPGGATPTGDGRAGGTDAKAGRKRVTLKLYATLQDLLPSGAVKNAARIEIAADASLNEIIDAYRVPRELAHLVLINGVFVCDEDRDARGRLQEGDVLAIWPPVAGG